MSNGSTAAEKAKWKKLRATPRKLTPAELHQRAVARQERSAAIAKMRIDMVKAAAAGDGARRNKARNARQGAYELGLLKNAELGIDPVYLGGRGFWRVPRGSLAHKAWLKTAKAWDVAHQPKPEAEAA